MRGKNFSNNPDPDVGGETAFTACNFCQPAPVDSGGDKRGVRLFPGDDTPRTFIECNLTNCEPPPGSTIEGCNTAVVVYDVVTGTDTVTIDGEPVELVHHSHFGYGYWTPEGYVDYGSPTESEVD